ncbi:MAG: hypothetical protein ACLGHN_06755 [Bacteriovoracia bacterium]
MKIYYSPYSLKPLKRANRLSSLDSKPGVLLKGVLGDKITFADYFPHLPLGDRTCDQFLQEFRFQDVEYDRKVFDLLLRDFSFQTLKPQRFKNHQLWTGTEGLMAQVIKYKMLHQEDRAFLIPLNEGRTLRLDCNALFNRKDYDKFVSDIPQHLLKQIEYIEDPLHEKDWKDLSLPSAMDFIEGSEFKYYIYKPNVEFFPTHDATVIFSAYLGSPLGQWHTYCELVEKADLSLTHGIVATNFYEDEKPFLTGSFKDGFIADVDLVKKLYQNVNGKDWKLLCSI